MQTRTPTREFAGGLVVVVLLLTPLGALLAAQAPAQIALAAALVLALFAVSFLNTEAALHLIILSMLLSPELVVGGVGGVSLGKPLTKGEALVLRFEDLVLIIAGVAWLAKTAVFKELGLIVRTKLNRPILLYAVSLVVATLFGVLAGAVPPKPGFFFTLKYLEFFVVYLMAANNLRDEGQLKRLLFTAFATGAIASFIGILQIPSGQRVAAPFEGQYGEPNTFGGYLVFMLALVLGIALNTGTPLRRAGWWALGGILALPFLYTLSRTSWLAAGPMVLTLILLNRRRLFLMTLVGLLIILAPFVMPRQVIERYEYTFNQRPEPGQIRIGATRLDTSTSARIGAWQVGLEGWMKSPILGHGVTGYLFVDAQYVRVMVESGLVGLAAFLSLLVAIGRAAAATHGQAPDGFYRGLTGGYLAGFVALLIHSFGANTFIIVRIMEPFWFFTAVIVMLPTLVRAEPSHGGPLTAPPGPPPPRGGTRARP